jgi:2-oxoacid dehydrogenases acyltransferase (catalytic domain)
MFGSSFAENRLAKSYDCVRCRLVLNLCNFNAVIVSLSALETSYGDICHHISQVLRLSFLKKAIMSLRRSEKKIVPQLAIHLKMCDQGWLTSCGNWTFGTRPIDKRIFPGSGGLTDQGAIVDGAGDGTISVTNLGEPGVKNNFGVIDSPRVAPVEFGQVVERSWASGGMISVKRTISATLSDGHILARK